MAFGTLWPALKSVVIYGLWRAGALFAVMLGIPAMPGEGAELSDRAGVEFFEKHVRPVLVENCYKCHSAEAEKGVKGGLRLDTREGLLKGGDNGPAIMAGNPDKSLLIKAVRYSDENLQMPPKGKKLAEEQIEHLIAWVKMGAPDPRTAEAQSSKFKAQKHIRLREPNCGTRPACLKLGIWRFFRALSFEH